MRGLVSDDHEHQLLDRHPWKRWDLVTWLEYREDQLWAIERFGEPWASRIGTPLVARANHYIAKLKEPS